MGSNKKGPLIPRDPRFLSTVINRIKLIYRLFMDPRVNPVIKVLPFGGLVYFLIPSLIPPDLIPGPIDDAAILWLTSYLFVELCPPDVVEEHMQALNGTIDSHFVDMDDSADDVIDGEVIDIHYKDDE
jgi:hypothetical protein